MLLTVLKYILLFSLLLLIGLATFGLVVWMHWPWWITLFFLLGYTGLYLTWILIRKLLLRRREQNFVQDVIKQDDAYIKGQESGREELQDLQQRWQEAVETLKSSHLSKQGNPLYVLPWYMVIGESRSGKSTAIQSADLSAPFAETRKISGIAGTRNCDWWFSDQAVILDTAGRYTIPLEEGRDKEEWQKFLSLLVKYRKKEPLNGLVVTMAADKLLQADPETLLADAHNIRQRIDELMRVLGKVFPVYVLITKCDLVQGMTQFCDQLPEQSLKQAMGLMNRKNSKDIRSFVVDADNKIGERLQRLRLQLLSAGQASDRPRTASVPDLLIFPNEFQNLLKRLSGFAETVFKENSYQETPILRGLYFSSGRQEGTPYSHFLHSLGLIKQQEVLPGTNRGLFLHDLFSRILPRDRALFAPTQKAMAWNRFTRNIGLTAWAAIILALCGMLSFSFVKNLTTIRSGADIFAQSMVLHEDLLTDTTVIEHFQSGISTLEEKNNSWWFPRFGLHESEQIEQHLKDEFCRRFKDRYSTVLDTRLNETIAGLSANTPDNTIGSLVAYLARRINLIQARLDNRNPSTFTSLNQPSFQLLIGRKNSAAAAELSDRFLRQYHYYLAWQDNRDLLLQEQQDLQRNLLLIQNQRDFSLNWLVSWTNNNIERKTLDVQDFWPAPLNRDNIATIPPAFTLEGRKFIESLLQDIDSALPDPLLISANKKRFHDWYNQAYEQVWYDFAVGFPKAEYYLPDSSSWQQTATIMAMEKSPYFAVLKTMAEQLSGLEQQSEKDGWVGLVEQIDQARKDAEREAAIKNNKSILDKVAKKGKKILGKLEKKTGLDAAQITAAQLAAGKKYSGYRESLKNISLAASSREVSYSMAAEIFKDDPATSKSPFYQAKRDLVGLRTELNTTGRKQRAVWRLLSGPLSFLRDYVSLEAACHLNGLWEKNVLVEIQDISDKTKLNQAMFLNNGYAIRFVKGPASPFLGRSLKKGFYPKTALGRMLPFKKSFLQFLTDGIRLAKSTPDLEFSEDAPLGLQLEANSIFGPQPTPKKEDPVPPPPTLLPSYSVLITANPTSVNREARATPHATTLALDCGAETTRLVNLNYPIRKKFTWEPKKCQTVVLQIEAGSLILTKKYEGKFSFAEFVKDFQNGSHVFSSADFAKQKKQLARLRIKTLKINFRIKGGQPLIDLLDQKKQREEALARLEEKMKMQAAGGDQGIKELLTTWERKQKMSALENEAIKQAWKAKQEAKAQAIKQAWEEKLPDIPYDITNCWDK